MANATEKLIGVRHSIRFLQDEFDKGNKAPLLDLVRAWRGIQELPPSDVNSYFVLAGYHGEPFTERPDVDALSPLDSYIYWGGYCNHGNVLFPTWHRMYLWRLERALQSIVPGVMMAFWDETADESLRKGIPSILTQGTVVLDGETIRNPLRSYVLPELLRDDYWQDSIKSERNIYFKPPGYETVRYPLSGLVSNTTDREATRAHNDKYPDSTRNTDLLNENVRTWLQEGEAPRKGSVAALYRKCLDAPNYTVFSNTTSSAAWNEATGTFVVPLELPHNDIHISIGGFAGPILASAPLGGPAKANGDMGENNTASFDPIFFFHHCFVDRMFWLWQTLNGFSEKFEVIDAYAGTNALDYQGPTTGLAPGQTLSLKTPLNPFFNVDEDRMFTSEDCINTEKQLGYTYGPGSYDPPPRAVAAAPGSSTRTLTVRGIDRADFQGSFVLAATATVKQTRGKTKKYYLGHHSVLSRWNVKSCANCLTHLEVIAHFPLTGMPEKEVDDATFSVEVQHRGKVLPREFTYDWSVSGKQDTA
jgi:tyrosinase